MSLLCSSNLHNEMIQVPHSDGHDRSNTGDPQSTMTYCFYDTYRIRCT